MGEPELHAKRFTQLHPVCESGRHVMHPGETCEEWEEFAKVARAWFEREAAKAFAAWHAEVDRILMDGNDTGELYGLRHVEPAEPTPIERALAILAPHLAAVPLYRPHGVPS